MSHGHKHLFRIDLGDDYPGSFVTVDEYWTSSGTAITWVRTHQPEGTRGEGAPLNDEQARDLAEGILQHLRD
jgi:hypothetical protein